MPKKKLKQEVLTQWNSTFEMLSSIVEQQQAISSALAGSKKASDRDMIPTSTDLRKVGYLIKVLDPLQHATTLLCSEKTPTLSIVQPLVTALLRKHLETTDDDPKLVLDLKSTIATSLRSHFSGSHQTQIRLLASVLDPRYKDLRFLPSSERIKVYNDLQIVVSTFHHDSDEPLEDYPPPKRYKEQGLLDFSESSDSNGDSPTEPSGQVEKEINVYRAEESIDKSEDPLIWWSANTHRFKHLSVLAQTFFSMCAISVPAERLFSKAGALVNKKRASVHPKNVNCVLFFE